MIFEKHGDRLILRVNGYAAPKPALAKHQKMLNDLKDTIFRFNILNFNSNSIDYKYEFGWSDQMENSEDSENKNAPSGGGDSNYSFVTNNSKYTIDIEGIIYPRSAILNDLNENNMNRQFNEINIMINNFIFVCKYGARFLVMQNNPLDTVANYNDETSGTTAVLIGKGICKSFEYKKEDFIINDKVLRLPFSMSLEIINKE